MFRETNPPFCPVTISLTVPADVQDKVFTIPTPIRIYGFSLELTSGKGPEVEIVTIAAFHGFTMNSRKMVILCHQNPLLVKDVVFGIS